VTFVSRSLFVYLYGYFFGITLARFTFAEAKHMHNDAFEFDHRHWTVSDLQWRDKIQSSRRGLLWRPTTRA